MIDDEFYMEVDKFIETLKKCEYIRDEKDVKKLCEKAKEILSQEGNVINLNAPITVNFI
jgi:serine/threonine-protein phosphatase 2A catalytic subunit